jgi:ribosomal protein L11 methyltransferase
LTAASYRVFRYTLPVALEDEVSAWLAQPGTAGSEVAAGAAGEVAIAAYFPAPHGPGPLPPALERAGVRLVEARAVEPADWLEPFRRAARPFPVGRRLLLDPREPDSPPPAPARRRLLRVPARTAFGTGSHESTRLALELLEGMDVAGRRVLDVGTGSGILGLAALAFGARQVVACDVDPGAPLIAAQNAALNRLRPLLFAGGLDALGAGAGEFDVALVNVVPDEIAGELPVLAARLVHGGEAVFSGLLVSQGRAVLERLRRLGLRRVGRRRDGEWIAYRVRKAA